MPTWTITQYFHQKIKAAGDSKRENLCQQDSDRVTSRTPGASTSGQLEAAGAPISVRPVATEDSSSGEKSHLHPSIDGENTSNFTLNDWTVCRFPAERFVWASSWLTKDHKDFKAWQWIKASLGRKQFVPRQVKILIDRKTHSLCKYCRSGKHFDGQRSTLLSDPAAKLLWMKVHAFSYSTLCIGVSNRNKIGGRKERTRVL